MKHRAKVRDKDREYRFIAALVLECNDKGEFQYSADVVDRKANCLYRVALESLETV